MAGGREACRSQARALFLEDPTLTLGLTRSVTGGRFLTSPCLSFLIGDKRIEELRWGSGEDRAMPWGTGMAAEPSAEGGAQRCTPVRGAAGTSTRGRRPACLLMARS